MARIIAGVAVFAMLHLCKAQVFNHTDASGSLFSTNYPNANYPPNVKQRHYFQLPDKTQFTGFDVEGYTEKECGNDWVAIYDGSFAAALGSLCSPSNIAVIDIVVLCNNHAPPVQFTYGVKNSAAILEFCTDSAVQAAGFEVFYSSSGTVPTAPTLAPPTHPPPPSCGGDINLAASGNQVITSPNFPNAYPNYADCSWSVTAPEGSLINIQSSAFDLEGYTDSCFYDWVEVLDKVLQIRYCRSLGPQLTTTGNKATITFHSDDSVQWSGFQIELFALTPATTIAPPLSSCNNVYQLNQLGDFYELTSPGWPNSYPNNENCVNYVVNMATDNSLVVELRFDSFVTEAKYDTLTISYDGEQEVYSDYVNTDTKEYIDAKNISFLFVTDSLVTMQGYKLRVSLLQAPFMCMEGQFKCKTYDKCIPYTARCDGIYDCPDSSDEGDAFCNAMKTCGTQTVKPNAFMPDEQAAGRTVSKPSSWPWTVGVFRFGTFICGGTLVSENWVLGAASCFFMSPNPTSYQIKVGAYDRDNNEPDEIVMDVEAVYIHPDYDSNTHVNDIALIKLNDDVPFPFNDNINVPCLPDPYYLVSDHTPCVSSGWGITISEKIPWDSTAMSQLVVPTIPNDVCNDPDHYDGQVDFRQLCAGYEEGGADICSMDEGNPLVCPDSSGRWVLQGIASYHPGSSIECGQPKKPGVYTRVAALMYWILDTIDDQQVSPSTAA